MDKESVFKWSAVVLIGGYVFSFFYAFVIDTIQSDFHAAMWWVWENRHDSDTDVLFNMVHGAILYLTIVVTVAVYLIVDELKKLNK